MIKRNSLISLSAISLTVLLWGCSAPYEVKAVDVEAGEHTMPPADNPSNGDPTGNIPPSNNNPPTASNPPVVTDPPVASNPPVVTDPPVVTNPPGGGCHNGDHPPTSNPPGNLDAYACGNPRQNKVLVCHVPPGNPRNRHEICIDRNGLGGHGLDGSPQSAQMHSMDYLGSCAVVQ